MFDFLEEMFDDTVETVTRKVRRTVNDPVGELVKSALQPVSDAIEVVDGLTEGELRTRAIARLGADAVSGMALSELISWYENK